MRKENKVFEIILANKRNKKKLRRQKKAFKGLNSFIHRQKSFNKKRDLSIIDSFSFKLHDFLNENLESNVVAHSHLYVPEDFSLEFNYDQAFNFISKFRNSIIYYIGREIILDFSKCKNVDFSALFLLKIIGDEYYNNVNKLSKKAVYFNLQPKIKIIQSKVDRVNLKLVANKIIPDTKFSQRDFIPILASNIIKGRKTQKHYIENKKGPAITKIRNFINGDCMRRFDLEFNEDGISYIDGLLSEVINNAEDHSCFESWYIFGNLFETNREEVTSCVGEINLAILNFGNSIYEGFEDTKKFNKVTYSEMSKLANDVKNKMKSNKDTIENLISLYSLQEGISRLKYDDESRGTGTMKFIKSFLSLGDYESEEMGFMPRLLIYSGNTSLKCDNKFKPYLINGRNYLSLNEKNDLTLPPESTHLKSLSTKFPGTLLVVKIYLNESHLKNKIKSNGN